MSNSKPHRPSRHHFRSIIHRGAVPIYNEMGNDIEFFDSHDYRDIWDFASRPDPYEEREFAPLRNDKL